MMARATRSSTADLKRKRSPEHQDTSETNDNAPNKLLKKDLDLVDEREDEETKIDCSSILAVLEAEDKQDLLHRVYNDSGVSLRSLLSTSTPISTLKAAINSLRPIASKRAQKSNTAGQQDSFCNLALALVEQVLPDSQILHQQNVFEPQPSSPPRQKPNYALVQHLPSGDWWSSSTSSISDPAVLQTGNAELVAIFPTPSSPSDDKPSTTVGSYCPKLTLQKRTTIPPRRVPTGAYLDYGIYSSFAPSFDSDGEVVGRKELGQFLWYREEKKRRREEIKRERIEGTGSIVEVPSSEPQEPTEAERQETSIIPDEELEALLGPEDVDSIKVALNSLELEKSVQQLLERNQRALARLSELQKERLMKSPPTTAEEGSEEWETAQAILDSLTLLASLRPRSSSQDSAAIIPPPSVLHKLHRTLALQPTPSWPGTLPPGRTTALRDDSTVKIRPSTAPTAPVATTSTPSNIATPSATTTSASTLNHYPYAYGTQQQGYRAPAAGTAPYTPYKPAASYYASYNSQQQQGYYAQQAYAGASANQQPYGAQYAAWMGYYQQAQAQQAQQQAAGGASGRGTPLPAGNTPVAATYSSFFGLPAASTPTATTTAAAAGTPLATRAPAVANTVATPSSATPYAQASLGAVPTLPPHLRTSSTPQQPVTTNGFVSATPTTATVPTNQAQTQPAT